MRTDTAIKQLLDSLKEARNLGLRQVQLDDILIYIKKYQIKELLNMQDCFIKGMCLKDKRFDPRKSADNFIEENYTYYL